RWRTVEKNVRKLRDAPHIKCIVTPCIQIYNINSLVELYSYCDAMDLQVGIMNVLRYPQRLAIENLPVKARKAAAAKLVKYHDGACRAADKPCILSLAHYLDNLTTPVDPKIVYDLMVFTNDLDASREQSFRSTHPELVQLYAEDGFEWIPDTFYAT